MKPAIVYAMIRHSDDGYDWIDTSTIAPYHADTIAKAKWADSRVPQWQAAHKQVRVARFVLKETDGDA